jgi:hypothetical protein
MIRQILIACFSVVVFAGCIGPKGQDGVPCTSEENADGSFTVTCPDGTSATTGGPEPAEDAGNAVFDGGGGDAGSDAECPTVIGSMTIENSWDVDAISGYCRVTGDLRIIAAGLTNVDGLAALQSVGGELRIESNTAMTAVRLPALTAVGGTLAFWDNDVLTSVDLPALASTGGSLYVGAMATMTAIDLPLLETIGGDLTIRDNPSLTRLAMPALASVAGAVAISIDSALTTCTGTFIIGLGVCG